MAPLLLSASGASEPPDSPPHAHYAIATYDGPSAPQRAEAATLGLCLRDEKRGLLCLEPAPRGPLLAAVDTLGRLLLLDGARTAVVRLWKVWTQGWAGSVNK